MSIKKEVIMQERCIYCKREQYAPVVYPVSHGEMGCAWCGQVPPVFTDEKEYGEELNKPIKKIK
jgi:hypothetical protein